MVRPPRRDDLDAVLAVMRAHDTAGWGGSDWTRATISPSTGRASTSNATRGWSSWTGASPATPTSRRARSGRLLADGYVDPSQRGLGIGSALAAAVEDRAASEPERRRSAVLGPRRERARSSSAAATRGAARVAHGDRPRRRRRTPQYSKASRSAPTGPGRSARSTPRSKRRGRSAGGCTRRGPSRSSGGALSAGPGTTRRSTSSPRTGTRSPASRSATGSATASGAGSRRSACGPPGGAGASARRCSGARSWRSSQRGERTVALQVDAESPTGATRLYERAGMRVLYEVVVWEKILADA